MFFFFSSVLVVGKEGIGYDDGFCWLFNYLYLVNQCGRDVSGHVLDLF